MLEVETRDLTFQEQMRNFIFVATAVGLRIRCAEYMSRVAWHSQQRNRDEDGEHLPRVAPIEVARDCEQAVRAANESGDHSGADDVSMMQLEFFVLWRL